MNHSKCAAAVAAMLVLAAMASGQPPASGPGEDIRLDPTTGRDRSHWPPDRWFDHKHLKLDLTIADMESKILRGLATLDAVATGSGSDERATLELDCGSTISVESVEVDGARASFQHLGQPVSPQGPKGRLVITLPRAVRAGQGVRAVIAYTAKEPGYQGNGLNWLRTRGDGEDGVPPMIYSQGESEWNHLWFPCHDSPNEKLTTEITATVPQGFEVVSNGRLLSKAPVPSPGAENGQLVKWHWLQDKPHTAYLVTLVVGKFDVVDVGGPTTARPGLSMPVYGRPGSAEVLKDVFANTPVMVKFLEDWFDEPYPWDKYAQVLVRNFRWGGMENTSATTLGEFAGAGSRGDQDELIIHELAHQWTGNLVTCKSWEHLWLNEGWATFAEWLWVEREQGHDAYLDTVKATLTAIGMKSRGAWPRSEPMASRFYEHADTPFEKPDDPYGKGGLVLHMLRERLGDDVFQRGMRLFLDRHKFGSVETDDFRHVLEEVSGQSLERFFEQWCRRPGVPRLDVDLAWDESAKRLSITLEQTQHIDAENPAYGLRVPIFCGFGDGGEGTWVFVDTDARSKAASFALPRKPDRVRIDPHMQNAAPHTIRKGL